MNKHIPGPWTLNVDSKFPRVATIVGPQGKDIEIIAAISNETEMATLRLIAASPDLLGALRMVRDADEDCRKDGLPIIPSVARKRIDDAIAKAEGA